MSGTTTMVTPHPSSARRTEAMSAAVNVWGRVDSDMLPMNSWARPLGSGPGRDGGGPSTADHGEAHPVDRLPGHGALEIGEGHREGQDDLAAGQMGGDGPEPGGQDDRAVVVRGTPGA